MKRQIFTLPRTLCLPLALLAIAVQGAWALNSPEQEVTVRKLTAAEIMEITSDKTWIIDFDNLAITSTTIIICSY